MENQNLKKIEKKATVLLLKILTVLNLVVGGMTVFIFLVKGYLSYSVLFSGIAIIVSALFIAAFTRVVIAAELYIENNK